MNAKTFAIGMSSAASWAWGTSLIMGQQIAQQKGPEAFWIWAIANAFALALFGFVHYKGYIKPEIYRSKFVKTIALVIQLFCLVVQLNFINQIVNDLIHDSTTSYLITFAVGCVFVIAMYGKGLRASIFTDVLQWAIAIVTIFVILGVALYDNVPHHIMATAGINEYVWAIWSAIILLCGPIGDVQHWQRAENDETKRGYYLGAVLFGLYMVLIFAMSLFQFNNVMNAILLVTVLCVTTSTIDSIAVATHEMGGKKIGTAVCLIICAVWGVLAEIGMVSLWSSFGVIRVVFAVAILVLPVCLMARTDRRSAAIGISAIVGTGIVLAVFIALGSITVTNVFGAICSIVAFSLIAYLVLIIACGKKDGLKGELTV